jgi:hypothetical protein
MSLDELSKLAEQVRPILIVVLLTVQIVHTIRWP